MKFFNQKLEASIMQDARLAESAVNSTFTYFAKVNLNPTPLECETMLLDSDGIRAFVYDNRFENYIRVAFNGAFIPPARLDEERKQFNPYYNYFGVMEFYSRKMRFTGSVSWRIKNGTAGSYELNSEELEAFIQSKCTFELTPEIEERAEFLKLYADVLNDGFDSQRLGYITKQNDGRYVADVDRFIIESLPR